MVRSNAPVVGLILLAVIAVGFGVWLLASGQGAPSMIIPSSPPDLPGCVKSNLAAIQPSKVDNALLKETSAVCYSQIHGQGLLNDFQIRRLKFLQQAYDERILLWMVVGITISGVILAALQLLASYHLALAGQGNLGDTGEVSLERSKISLKSSVTGLFILVFSLAFFTIFVFEIYKIKEIDADGRRSEAPAPPNYQVGAGIIDDSIDDSIERPPQKKAKK